MFALICSTVATKMQLKASRILQGPLATQARQVCSAWFTSNLLLYLSLLLEAHIGMFLLMRLKADILMDAAGATGLTGATGFTGPTGPTGVSSLAHAASSCTCRTSACATRSHQHTR